MGPGKECMRNQARENGENERSESRSGSIVEATVRQKQEEKEKKKQRLSSEMLKRK